MEYKLNIEKAENSGIGKLFIAIGLMLVAIYQLFRLEQKIGFTAIVNIFKLEYILFLSIFFLAVALMFISDWFTKRRLLKNQIHPIFNVEREFVELNYGLIHHRVYYKNVDGIEVVKGKVADDAYLLRLNDKQLFPIYNDYPYKEIISEIKHFSGLEEKKVKEIKHD